MTSQKEQIQSALDQVNLGYLMSNYPISETISEFKELCDHDFGRELNDLEEIEDMKDMEKRYRTFERALDWIVSHA